jgi:hypothetical protein
VHRTDFTQARSTLQDRINISIFYCLDIMQWRVPGRRSPAMSGSPTLCLLSCPMSSRCCFVLRNNYEKPTPPRAPAPMRASSNHCTKLDEETRSTSIRQRNTIMRPSASKNSHRRRRLPDEQHPKMGRARDALHRLLLASFQGRLAVLLDQLNLLQREWPLLPT